LNIEQGITNDEGKNTEKNEEPRMTANVFINLFAANKLLDIPC